MSRAGFGLIVVLVLGALFLAQNLDEAQAQQLPPGPKALASHTFADAHRFDLVQFFLDFAPGAWTPEHTHGGVGYATVVEGSMVVREKGSEKAYKPGESWAEIPGEYAVVGNPGSSKAVIAVTFLLPKGAALTTPR